MRDTETIKGRVVRRTGRKPKTVEGDRTCAAPGCDTRLTRYNRGDHCYAHTGVRHPRVRGRRTH